MIPAELKMNKAAPQLRCARCGYQSFVARRKADDKSLCRVCNPPRPVGGAHSERRGNG